MNEQPVSQSRKTASGLFLGLAAMLAFFVASGLVSYLNTRTLIIDGELVQQTHSVLTALSDILSYTKDAETGQRGYVITGEDRYLDPYNMAVPRIKERLEEVDRLTKANVKQQVHLPVLRTRLENKLKELEKSIELRRKEGFETAQAFVLTDQGRLTMEAIRDEIEEMSQEERITRDARVKEMDASYSVALTSDLLTGVLGVALSLVVAYLLRRTSIARAHEEWLQSGQIRLSQNMIGDTGLQSLGERVLKTLAEYLGAQAGALFANDKGYRRVATYGVPVANGTPEALTPGDGLLWQAIKDRRMFIVNDVPEGYLHFGSALGSSKPRHLLIAPVAEDGVPNAVIELGFLRPLTPAVTELFERVSDAVGVAIRAVQYRTELQDFLEETQRQSEELQTQGEELRVSNEELEEQSRALRESQARLENQQAELEQTNAQLEEQAQLLELQKDEVDRSNRSLESQTRRLEQASQYKSDFLANMSHELRTPLNSSLILAKLLADNPNGNLSAEQVQYAQTIQSAGNDLLALINDILDLSKIEAGHMEVRPESVSISRLLESLARTFQPLADQRGLELKTVIDGQAPQEITTDPQRLEQILKNLLSNAIKFTEQGEVEISVRTAEDQRVNFSVRDTGIGIPEDKQGIVFEAFQQVEGTTNRRFGGTGLGLSISRQLTRLLGGDLHLESTVGRGSTFTVTVPEVYDATILRSNDQDRIRVSPPDRPRAEGDAPLAPRLAGEKGVARPSKSAGRLSRVDDDRERLSGNGRVILIVEDDEPFSRILYDLAHELNFQCLLASTAEEGIAIATQYLPSAVILDVGLPDNSGLLVLDRLKHDRRTRHIPVHVVSASDNAETALSLGAIGYLLKPVKREELEGALKQLESHFAQRMRRVLVVEDDPVQLDALCKLLASHDVETVGARTAVECLQRLRETTYDCMVLDLTLPDASGYNLLEILGREEMYAFPPVIVYTGRELSADEEQRLRKYSKSIIIKGAKSPERLLDEVTLFLHQVVAELPAEQQRMLERARSRDAAIEDRRILVVEDDVRNVFAITSLLEPRGALIQIARNGQEALDALRDSLTDPAKRIDLVLMDVMMPVMDGITAIRKIRAQPEFKKLAIIMLTAKAMKDDQETCLAAGANDYMPKPLDVEKLLSLVRVWMPR
ncbi:MAG TPA: response regulator [Pirellulales bacterium]|jgi:signal transduction histidine kinase/CheY-like chemotaxis protein/CHASE3 domain sensor protein|nr:response regulator [Pirellulales bacterium]